MGKNEIRMPPAEWQLESGEQGQKEHKLSPHSTPVKGKKARQKKGRGHDSATNGMLRGTASEAKPSLAQRLEPAMKEAAKKRSPFFAAGTTSLAADNMKSFKKMKLSNNPLSLSPPATVKEVETAAAATPDRGQEAFSATSSDEEKRSLQSPNPRRKGLASPVKPAAGQKTPEFQSSPSPWKLLEISHPSKGAAVPVRQEADSMERQHLQRIASKAPGGDEPEAEPSDRMGDWNPGGGKVMVSSEGEGRGPSPDASSIVVEADDSQRALDAQSPSFHTADMPMPEGQLQSTADGAPPKPGDGSADSDTQAPEEGPPQGPTPTREGSLAMAGHGSDGKQASPMTPARGAAAAIPSGIAALACPFILDRRSKLMPLITPHSCLA